MKVVEIVTALLFVSIVTIETFAYTIFLLAPSIPLLFVVPPFRSRCVKWYRWWTGWVESVALGFAVAGLEHGLQIKIKLYGDQLPIGERALILCNHRTRVDWVFMWCFCARTGQLAQLRIVLKDALKSLPGIGWATQICLYVFLSRDRIKDLFYMRELFQYLVHNNYATTLLLFPEGTDLSPSNIEKAQKYSDDRGLQKFYYVLQPKIAGFLETMEYLGPGLDAVYDLTIAYVDHKNRQTGAYERPDERSLIIGRGPKEVHMLVKRTPIDAMPLGDENALKSWLMESFQEKERQLTAFYERRECDTWTAGFPKENELNSLYTKNAHKIEIIGIGVFVCTIAFTSYMLVYWWMFKWYAMSMCCIFTILTGFGDGLDMLELRLGRVFGPTWGKEKKK